MANTPAGLARTLFITLGILLTGYAIFLHAISARFHYAADLAHTPIIWFVIAHFAAGTALLALLQIVPALSRTRTLVLIMIVCGAIMRLALLGSEPILEIDFYRYLWDGAMVANGYNPYTIAPADALNSREPAVRALADHAAPILTRVNYPDLRSLYPPVAQLGFALANILDLGALRAWRVVCICCEGISLLLLLALLKEHKQSPLWAALYWWNPLIIKELINSAHSEALLVPLLLAAAILISRRQTLRAVAAVGLAAGVKLWPLLLALFALVPTYGHKLVLLRALALLAAVTALAVVPLFIWGLGENSGLFRYSSEWVRNASIFSLLFSTIATLLPDFSNTFNAVLTRALVTAIMAGFAIAMAIKTHANPSAASGAILAVTACLFLLSPTQFPWYFSWFAPLLCVVRVRALLLLTPMLSLYYLRFYFDVNNQSALFEDAVVWAQFAPVWVLLAYDYRWRRARYT